MEKLFVNIDVAKLAKSKNFNTRCLGFYFKRERASIIERNTLGIYHYEFIEGRTWVLDFPDVVKECVTFAPTPQQLIDWLEEKHNIHVSRIWYNDRVTPTRWVYHIDGDYAGSDFDEALIQALNRIK